MARPPARRPRRTERPARMRQLTDEERAQIDYRNPEGLRPYLSSRGKIKSRRQTGLSRRDQAQLARQVKRARELALLPYVAESAAGDSAPRARRERG
ncbi:MAG TPA: 30S ribosomal protein S18 [Solirubrobacteraceae bacterium]|nr:30S ribosomal protein S18 [Solirubrobacteraceae bacterium]